MPSLLEPVVRPGTLNSRVQPDIHGAGLTLRPWLPSDRATVVAAYSDPGIRQWHCRSMTNEEATDWIAHWPGRWRAESGAGWAVLDEGKVAGQISLRRLDLPLGQGEVSYWVLPAARGRRLAPRALTTLSEWAFGRLGLHRVELMHSTANEPSCRVAWHAGFRHEGTKRSEMRHADGWHDMHLHARLATD
jgi:RimJ/RimL family protein N-acetyltransferase